MNVLFAAAEMFPWLKVGGLGDVIGSLPRALRELGHDVRVLLPGHPSVLENLGKPRVVRELAHLYGGGPARILLGEGPGSLPVYVLDSAGLFAHQRDLYAFDGALPRRFAALSRVAALLAVEGDGHGFVPDLLHVHDWQTALATVWVSHDVPTRRIPTVLTIHNLAYQGQFDPAIVPELGLPEHTFHMHGVEFHGCVGFLKGGLVYATRLTTVSPTYAREILTPDGGFGLEGVLQHRRHDLYGILNGIDTDHWNPKTSTRIAAPFTNRSLARRPKNREALAKEVGLELGEDSTLFAVVSRLVDLKGLDLVVEAAGALLRENGRLLVLGRGDPLLEARFVEVAAAHPGRIVTIVGYDEALAERIFAGADVVMVPSRSEPCGLTQMMAMRYAALPLVRRTGGLADSVLDADERTLANGTATGFVFDAATVPALEETIVRAARLHRTSPETIHAMRLAAMRRDSSWSASAAQYVDLYRSLVR